MLTAVTGASGFLGGAVVRALLAEGRQVKAIDLHRGETLDDLPVEFVQGDILDSASLNHALFGADVVYHLAAMIAVAGEPSDQVWRINVDGAANVAQAAYRAGVKRVVHCSSVHAYDLEGDVDELTEESPRAAKRAARYDRSKAAGEEKVRALVDQGLDAVIVNPTGVIGPLDFGPSRMGQVFVAMFANRLPAIVEGGFDWVDVRDVATSMIQAEKLGQTGENYLLPGHYVSLAGLAELATEVSGVDVTAPSAPMWLARAWGPLGNILGRKKGSALAYTSDSLRALRHVPPISGDKAARVLSHVARPTRESVRDIYNWFEHRGLLAEA